ncbi:Uma2 family endonuclease [Frigoriglobus tundricola]|uniref:Uma2 family endonuclease n=1 Tax=Frigoriglobus tundricola TaxID=2774151 RepID=A0A6M5YRF9_9BACT|nr:Uma2 family endonuclease [Frigoriglobus tundricola]QJW95841.1 Uma2 family endonuclease [Frigoriglobus tundricola]
MSTAARPLPYMPTFLNEASMAKFSTARYDRIVETGLLTPEDNVELLENYVVLKMSKNPAHDGTALRVRKRLTRALSPGWDIREQGTLALSDSRPEPDFSVVREDPSDYTTRHPTATDTALVIEIANTSIQRDKARIYARAGLVCYWIVNLEDRRIEVHTQPSGPGDSPAYASVQTFAPGDTVPLVLDGATVAAIPAADLLP